jgi:hypothetical protein
VTPTGRPSRPAWSSRAATSTSATAASSGGGRGRRAARRPGRRELAAALAGVEGWLGNREAWALHEAARTAPGATPVAVEIGSWKGRSTIALALGFRARGSGTVIAVDPHDGPRHRARGLDTFGPFLANVEAAGVAGHVRPIRATSAEARPAVTEPIDVLFVDGSHAYEDVLADIDLWSGALRRGATVAFHDAYEYPGVRRALRERVLRRGPFRRPRLVELTLFVTYAPGEWSRRDAVAAAAIRARVPAATVANRVRGRLRRRRQA